MTELHKVSLVHSHHFVVMMVPQMTGSTGFLYVPCWQSAAHFLQKQQLRGSGYQNIPVHDTTYKGRYQSGSSICTGSCLRTTPSHAPLLRAQSYWIALVTSKSYWSKTGRTGRRKLKKARIRDLRVNRRHAQK